MIEQAKSTKSLPSVRSLVTGGVLTVLVVGTYGSSLAVLVGRWWNEPDYIHGFLVPIFSGVVLWVRREMLRSDGLRVGPLAVICGSLFFAACAAMRWASAYYSYPLAEPLSLIPCLMAVALFVGGWRMLRWSAPSIAFLFFMLPLPGSVAGVLSLPLQRVGSLAGAYILQLLGYPTYAAGNVIHMPDAQLGVVEACSGIRMMMLFFAVCCGAAILMKRSPLEKLIVVFSAVPIAVVANVLRIVVTGILHQTAGHELADRVFHDLAGFFMMPTAVVLLWVELGLLSRLLTTRRPQRPISLGVPVASRES